MDESENKLMSDDGGTEHRGESHHHHHHSPRSTTSAYVSLAVQVLFVIVGIVLVIKYL